MGLDGAGGLCFGDGDLPDGFEAWIVKFRATVDPEDVGAMEEAYARMARAAGLTMTPSRLLPSKNGLGYFAARRFDRPGENRRAPMVSLSGAIEAGWRAPSIDYDTFLRATMAITRHAEDLEAAFRRMVFNILAVNRDDHTRQHAFLLTDHGWRLAPAYDLTFSTGPNGEHCMAVEGEGACGRISSATYAARMKRPGPLFRRSDYRAATLRSRVPPTALHAGISVSVSPRHPTRGRPAQA